MNLAETFISVNPTSFVSVITSSLNFGCEKVDVVIKANVILTPVHFVYDSVLNKIYMKHRVIGNSVYI